MSHFTANKNSVESVSPFDWKQYLIFGVKLYQELSSQGYLEELKLNEKNRLILEIEKFDIKIQKSNQETLLRIALGRIYYGIMNLLRLKLQLESTFHKSLHSKIKEQLRISYGKKIESYFNDLKTLREWADYDNRDLTHSYNSSNVKNLYLKISHQISYVIQWLQDKDILK